MIRNLVAIMVVAVVLHAPVAEARRPAADGYAAYTSPLTLDKFKGVQTGWTLAQAERYLGVRFKYVGLSSIGHKKYRHWTTKDHASLLPPHAELWVNGGVITGTSQYGLP